MGKKGWCHIQERVPKLECGADPQERLNNGM